MTESGYGARPCRGELIAIVAAGLLHVTTELAFSELVAGICSVGIVLAFLGYVVWRARSASGVLRAWGMRRDNFLAALPAHLGFAAVGTVALFGIGAALGTTSLPRSFWLTVALYPIWGVAQQFALQNLIARNLAGLISRPLGIALVAAALFGLSHCPRLDLVALTLIAGVCFTLVYHRRPNLWAVGIAHGWLGSVAIYLVVGEDPGAVILGLLGIG